MLKGLAFLLFVPLLEGAESSVYDFKWLPKDKELYVLQNQVFRKDSRVAVSAGIGKNTSGPFVDSLNYQLRLGHFFREDLGFEFIYSLNNGKENDVMGKLLAKGAAGTSRIVNNYIGGAIIWAPFYGKLNIFNQMLHFDILLGAGGTKLEEERITGTQISNRVSSINSYMSVLLTGGFILYLTRNINLRLDFITNTYWATMVTRPEDKSAYTQYDLTLSLGLII